MQRDLFILLLVLIQVFAPADAVPLRSMEILLTAESGERMVPQDVVEFRPGMVGGTVIEVFPEELKQTIRGIGTSFTESSAFVLAHLDPELRLELMERLFSEDGADFSLCRTHIGSCDFCVTGKYSYAEQPDDHALKSFTVSHDREGFRREDYPGIKDENYDLLPMIQEALAIKEKQEDRSLRMVASAWTAPPWMKDIETWYIPPMEENNWQGAAGSLKPEYEATYASYLLKYLEAYREAGVEIWALTPVNEPHGNGGHWESMSFSAESQAAFIRQHLGPQLAASPFSKVQLLAYDQNRDGMEHWAEVIFGDTSVAPFVDGLAIHWYESTFKVYEDAMDRIHASFPQAAIIHTEGCIDDLGNPAGFGIADTAGYQETDWFGQDSFWWNRNATDWAYTATWDWLAVEDHPMYTPVHRYARNIIVSLDHWMEGWIDWNAVLDHTGGPNHVGNNCGAPVMVNPDTGEVYYTPVYHVLAQLSRTIRPGDRALGTRLQLAGLDKDALHACATLNAEGILSVQVLNTLKQAQDYAVQIGGYHAKIHQAANSLQTIRFRP